MVPIVPGVRRKRTEDDQSSGSSSDAIDSMRPVAPKPRKRRRTILSAFSSIDIGKGESGGEEEDADSSQAVVDDEGYEEYSTSSSLEDEDDGDMKLLSDKEQAERKVMLDMVFGPKAKDPVDYKLQNMIRETLQKATAEPGSQDDMNIDASYSRASSVSLGEPEMKRSNSLPNIDAFMEDDSTMDTT